MALTFSQFDSTPQTILTDIKAAVLASSDWADISTTSGSSTTTAAANVGQGNVLVTAAAGFAVGSVIVIEPGTVREEIRNVTNMSGSTTLTMSFTTSLVFAHAAGSVVVARFADGTLAVKRADRRSETRTGAPAWWLLGDNPDGVDSRHRGPVADSDVLGVALARVWPRPVRLRDR